MITYLLINQNIFKEIYNQEKQKKKKKKNLKENMFDIVIWGAFQKHLWALKSKSS